MTATAPHPTPTVATPPRRGARSGRPGPAPASRQAWALAAAEARLLVRNKVALVNAVLMPAVMVLLVAGMGLEHTGLSFATFAPTTVLATSLVFVVYYTLVTAVVARREAHVLQRLRTGEASDATILLGLALPFVVITLAQTALAVVGAGTVLDAGPPSNLGLVVLASVLGVLVWTLLGIASTAMTRTVEHAQITTLPAILVPLLLSGLALPLPFLPEAVQRVAALTPLHPVVELMRLGLVGTDAHGAALSFADGLSAAVAPTLVLLAWSVVGWWLLRRYLRWEPRR